MANFKCDFWAIHIADFARIQGNLLPGSPVTPKCWVQLTCERVLLLPEFLPAVHAGWLSPLEDIEFIFDVTLHSVERKTRQEMRSVKAYILSVSRLEAVRYYRNKLRKKRKYDERFEAIDPDALEPKHLKRAPSSVDPVEELIRRELANKLHIRIANLPHPLAELIRVTMGASYGSHAIESAASNLGISRHDAYRLRQEGLLRLKRAFPELEP
jgi:hypothetical protein